jgi:flagellar biosynthetic protein FliO
MEASAGLTVAGLAAACVAAWLALRALSRREAAGGGMRVVGRLALEPRRSVVMVEAAGRVFLVGSSEGGMTLLAELTAQNAENRQTEPVYENIQSGMNVKNNKQSRLNVFGEAWRRVMRGGA